MWGLVCVLLCLGASVLYRRCLREVTRVRANALAASIENQELREQLASHEELQHDLEALIARVTRQSEAAVEDAREAVERQQEQLLSLSNSASDGVLVHSEGKILFANPSASRLLSGDSNYRLQGEAMERWVETQRRQGEDYLRISYAGESDGTSTEIPIRRLDLEVDFNGAPAVLSILRDLREEHRIERQLRLADRMTSLGHLVAGIAHELNNPMSYILANLEMLKDELKSANLGESLSGEMNEMLQEAFDGAVRISNTVGELQRFSRAPSSGGGTLRQCIQTAVAIVGPALRPLASLELEVDADALLLEGADPLSHVLVNLLTYSAERLREAPGSLGDHQVTLRASLEADGIVIDIRDTAPPFSAEACEHLFDPFSPRSVGKSGLSLAICYQMLANMGGSIEVLSDDAGLRVRFPAELCEALETPPADGDPKHA